MDNYIAAKKIIFKNQKENNISIICTDQIVTKNIFNKIKLKWLAGGVKKEGGIESLKFLFPKIKKAYFYGEAKNNFSAFFKSSGYDNFNINNNLNDALNSI